MWFDLEHAVITLYRLRWRIKTIRFMFLYRNSRVDSLSVQYFSRPTTTNLPFHFSKCINKIKWKWKSYMRWHFVCLLVLSSIRRVSSSSYDFFCKSFVFVWSSSPWWCPYGLSMVYKCTTYVFFVDSVKTYGEVAKCLLEWERRWNTAEGLCSDCCFYFYVIQPDNYWIL